MKEFNLLLICWLISESRVRRLGLRVDWTEFNNTQWTGYS